jgi:hypothetical protein
MSGRGERECREIRGGRSAEAIKVHQIKWLISFAGRIRLRALTYRKTEDLSFQGIAATVWVAEPALGRQLQHLCANIFREL